MAETEQPTADNKSPSRTRMLAGMVKEALVVRSPILGQLSDTAEAIARKPEKDESRLGNLVRSVQQSAVNNSAIIRQVFMMKDAILSVLKKDENGKEAPKTKEDKTTKEDKKTKDNESKSTSTAIIEYLENRENPYYVMMKSDNNYLEQIVQLLKQQSEIMQTNLQIAKESGERATTQKSLESVSRSDAARARAAQQPRDEMGRFVKQEAVIPVDAGGGLSEIADTVDDAFDIIKNLKKNWGVIAAGFASAIAVFKKFKGSIMTRISSLGKTLGGFVDELKPMARGFASRVGSLIDDAGKTAKSALPTVKNIAGRGLGFLGKGLGFAARAIGSTTFGAAMGILDPSDLGDGTPEGVIRRNYADELREMGFDPETGEAESPEAEARARAFIDEKIRTGQFVPEGGLPPEQQAAVEANAQRLREMGYDPVTGEPLTDEARETVERIRREREEREQAERRMRTTQEPPVLVPPTITMPTQPMSLRPGNSQEIEQYLNSLSAPAPQVIGSAPMARMQGYLSAMNGFAVPQRATPSAQPSTPVVVNNQGGPTSINNGGNVTNIITGGSSLALPQLAYNLSSSLS